jgi:ATP-dependent RNA helicase RhlE
MFKDKLNKKLNAVLVQNGFLEPKKIQLNTFAKISGGFDVIGLGPTGCGKSTTIAISAIQKLKYAVEDAPRALILVADKAKSLAMKEQFMLLTQETDLRITCVYEENDIEKDAQFVYTGTDILIGTPKRIIDLYFLWNLNINRLKLFVIDDAEMMPKIAAQGPIDRLALSLPKCQHLVFAESLNEKVEKLISKFIIAPTIIEVED